MRALPAADTMILHLGQETVVTEQDLIGIFDLETSTVSKHTRDFLARAEKAGQVQNITSDIPKSFALCKTGQNSQRVYILQVSTTTLRRRARVDKIHSHDAG